MKRNKALIVFVKAPQYGRVKTRLQKQIGAKLALQLYRQMVRDLLNNLSSPRNFDLFLFYTPPDKKPLLIEWLGGEYEMFPQAQGDLGKKMQEAFDTLFDMGYQSVIIVGSDLPLIDVKIIQQAFQCLSQVDMVLGPSSDGGYYLIGLKRTIPDLFKNMEWSTPAVLPETLGRARQNRLRIDLLAEQKDIDSYEDLVFYYNQLNGIHGNRFRKQMPLTAKVIDQIAVNRTT